jgi:hypothetical protein
LLCPLLKPRVSQKLCQLFPFFSNLLDTPDGNVTGILQAAQEGNQEAAVRKPPRGIAPARICLFRRTVRVMSLGCKEILAGAVAWLLVLVAAVVSILPDLSGAGSRAWPPPRLFSRRWWFA